MGGIFPDESAVSQGNHLGIPPIFLSRLGKFATQPPGKGQAFFLRPRNGGGGLQCPATQNFGTPIKRVFLLVSKRSKFFGHMGLFGTLGEGPEWAVTHPGVKVQHWQVEYIGQIWKKPPVSDP